MVNGTAGRSVDSPSSAHSNAGTGTYETDLQLTDEVEDLKHLHALSLRLATTNVLADVLIDVLRTAASLVGARLGSVQLLTPEGDLSMVGQFGFGDTVFERFSVVRLEDCSTCAVALQRRARVAVQNLRTDPKFSEIAAALRSYGVVGAVSTPVLDSSGNVLAMFSVYWLEEHEVNDRELRALDLCAELAGRHVERNVAAKALRDREQLLMRELAHRGKNLVSVIQAIAMRSLSGERTLDEAREVFIGRLRALSNTYNTLTEEAAENAALHDIVSEGLKSIGDRADFGGPAVVVPAKKAQTLSLVVHELATNAAKYGALSVESGRIKITWEVLRNGSDEDRFRFNWSEMRGPPANPPARTGFGSVIITSVVGAELNCKPTMEYAEGGFQYEFDCLLKALTSSPR
jgi:two-component sensor histidine kinase